MIRLAVVIDPVERDLDVDKLRDLIEAFVRDGLADEGIDYDDCRVEVRS